MHTAAKWALSITAGGLVLGALLGHAARPEMKDPAPRPWQLAGRDEAVASADSWTIEASPDDLNPFSGYRPALDYDALAWDLPNPDYDLAAPIDEPLDSPQEASEPAVEQAADAAEAAAGEALAKAATGNY